MSIRYRYYICPLYMDVSPPASFYSFLILFLIFDEDEECSLRNQQRGGRGSKSADPPILKR